MEKKKKINRKSIYIFIEVIDCFMLITLYSYFWRIFIQTINKSVNSKQ